VNYDKLQLKNWLKSSLGIGRSEDDAVGNSPGVRWEFAEGIGSFLGWRLDDAMGARGEFTRTSSKILERSLGTRREIAGGGS
ncbi:hypothetical protein B296_00020804, partial [Ensete ventricosum]